MLGLETHLIKLSRYTPSSSIPVGIQTLVLLLPALAWATIAAAPSRTWVIHVRGMGERVVFAELNAAAIRARMECYYDSDNPLQPNAMDPVTAHTSQPTRRLGCSKPGVAGDIGAVGLDDRKTVYLQIFSGDVSTPHGEPDPVIDHVLQEFRQTIITDADVEGIQECRAPNFERCSSPP